MATVQSLNFNPTSISGCALWLDANDRNSLILSGASVTQWNDKSGNGRNAIANSSPSYVTNGLNGRPSISFSNNILTSSGWAISSGRKFAWFSVFNSRSTANTYQRILEATEGFPNGFLGTDLFTYNVLALAGTTSYTAPNAAIVASTSNPQFLSYVFGTTEAGSNVSLVYVNGSTSASLAGNTGTLGSNGVYIGSSSVPPGNDSLIGYISEIICYAGDLTFSQRQQIEGYLAWKWGLQGSLPTSHPYYNIAPNSAGLGYPANIPVTIQRQTFLPNASPIVFFNPTSLPGCSLWLDASDPATLSLSGSAVTQWNDKSGNGFALTAPTTGQRPTIASSPFTTCVTFTTSQTINTTTSLTLAPTQSFFIVCSGQSNAFFGVEHSADTNANDGMYFYGANAALYQIRRGGNTNSVYDTTSGAQLFTTNSKNLVSLVNSNSGSYIWKINGTNRTLTPYSGFTSLSGNATTSFYINNRVTANVSHAEILVYNRAMTSTEVVQIEGYLAWKWGLAGNLPANHPFKNGPPGFSLSVPILPTQSFQPAQFTPRNISGLGLWYDAADLTTVNVSSSSVVQWNDKSSNAYHLTQGTSSNRPTYSNGVVNFLGSSAQFLSNAATNVFGNTGTFFITLTPSASETNLSRPFMVTNGNFLLIHDSILAAYYNSTNGSVSGVAEFSATLGSRSMRMIQRAGAPLAQYTLNGGAFTIAATTDGALSLAAEIRVGTGITYGATSYFTGSVCEILGYTTYLSSNDIRSVEGYLAWKWGLVGTLPATHPYKKFPPPPN
jgi:hypothetical protein